MLRRAAGAFVAQTLVGSRSRCRPSTALLRAASPGMPWAAQRHCAQAASVAADMAELRERVEDIQHRLDELEKADALNQLVNFYKTIPMAKLDLNEVVKRCEDPQYNQFIFSHRQLPLLLARMIGCIDNFPLGLNTMASARRVRKLYLQSFDILTSTELPTDRSKERAFYDAVSDRDEAHDEVVTTMAQSVMELKATLLRHKMAILKKKKPLESELHDIFAGKVNSSSDSPAYMETPSRRVIFQDLLKLQGPLDEFNTLMVEYRFVSRQMLQTTRAQMGIVDDDDTIPEFKRVGMVSKDLDLVRVVRGATEMAKDICTAHYGDSPEVNVSLAHIDDTPVTFPGLAENIHYIITELMKNSLRATVEKYYAVNASGIVTCDDMPPVDVVISVQEAQEEAVVCISDAGGGIARRDMRKVMSYSYTTAAPRLQEATTASSGDSGAVSTSESEESGTNYDGPSPLAGYGYGLPMSRIYARCFGGDVVLQSMEGYGTKAYFYISKKRGGQ